MTGNMPATKFWNGVPSAEGGYPGFNPRTETANGIVCEYDVAVTMRDGTRIFEGASTSSSSPNSVLFVDAALIDA